MDSANEKRIRKKESSFPQRPVAQLLGANGSIHAVSYSASPGSYILTGSADRSIRLYNPNTSTTTTTTASSSSSSYITSSSSQPSATAIPEGRLIQTYSGHGYEVLSLSIATDNARFASSGGDRAVYLWDVATAQTTRRFGATAHGHSGRVNSVTFGGADDSLIISGGLDTTVRIWDTKSGSAGGAKPVQVLSEARDAVTSVVVSGDAEIIAGSVDGRVRTYDVRMGKCVTDVFAASVTSLCLGRDGRTVLVGTLDSKVRLMDRVDGRCLRTYEDGGWRNEEFRVQSCFGGGERFVIAGDELTGKGKEGGDGEGDGSNEGRVWAWDLLTGKLVARIAVPWGPGASASASSLSGNRKQGMAAGLVGRDGRRKERKNVISCVAWKEGGFGNQFCVGGSSGVVTVFGE